MTVTVVKDDNFPSGEIKFSALRDTFRGTGTTIKASELFRNTNNNRRYDIVVPDSTENSDIAGDDYTGTDRKFSGSGTNLSLLTFRNSITYYHLNQTGTDSKLDFDTPDLWNSNLAKNVLKKINVNGTIHSDDPDVPAAQIGGIETVGPRNLTIHAYNGSKILGAGGEGGPYYYEPYGITYLTGQDGGDALYARSNNIDETPISRDIIIQMDEGSQIYGGGGGGGMGATGGKGGHGQEYNTAAGAGPAGGAGESGAA